MWLVTAAKAASSLYVDVAALFACSNIYINFIVTIFRYMGSRAVWHK